MGSRTILGRTQSLFELIIWWVEGTGSGQKRRFNDKNNNIELKSLPSRLSQERWLGFNDLKYVF